MTVCLQGGTVRAERAGQGAAKSSPSLSTKAMTISNVLPPSALSFGFATPASSSHKLVSLGQLRKSERIRS